MKKLLILLLPVLFLSTQFPAHADGVSFGIPLPFPFMFYNFGSDYSTQTYYNGYYRPAYYGRPVRYYGRAYYYGGYSRPYGYYRPYYRPRYWGYRPGWYGY